MAFYLPKEEFLSALGHACDDPDACYEVFVAFITDTVRDALRLAILDADAKKSAISAEQLEIIRANKGPLVPK